MWNFDAPDPGSIDDHDHAWPEDTSEYQEFLDRVEDAPLGDDETSPTHPVRVICDTCDGTGTRGDGITMCADCPGTGYRMIWR